jgi:hypothetical protein
MAKQQFRVTIGADPEFFLRTGDTFIPSTNIIGGSKKDPIPIPGMPEGFLMQEDNIMGEFNIPACIHQKEFSNSIEMALKKIGDLLPKNTEIVIQPSAVFKSKFIRSKAAKVFGCEPDMNAWTEEQNLFVPAMNPALRCCGGHVHVGLPNELNNYNGKVATIRAADIHLGLPSIIADRDTERRQMYGKAGAYRDKSYGVEYRTLSNFWIKTPYLREWTFTSMQNAVNATSDSGFVKEIAAKREEIVNAINNQDQQAAEKLCDHFNVIIP